MSVFNQAYIHIRDTDCLDATKLTLEQYFWYIPKK